MNQQENNERDVEVELNDEVLMNITGGCGRPTTIADSCVRYPSLCP